MKRLFFSLVLLTTIFITHSCKETNTGTAFSIGFISEYIMPSTLEAAHNNGREYISVTIGGKSYGDPTDIYRNLAEKYGDTKYKSKILPGETSSLTDEPNFISVICDNDIGEIHPAGTPLDDIILIYGWTYSEYINSGYKHNTKEIDDNYGFVSIPTKGMGKGTPFVKYLNEMSSQDFVLMHTGFFLYPPKDWPAGEYNLTVTVAGENFEISDTVTYIVE